MVYYPQPSPSVNQRKLIYSFWYWFTLIIIILLFRRYTASTKHPHNMRTVLLPMESRPTMKEFFYLFTSECLKRDHIYNMGSTKNIKKRLAELNEGRVEDMLEVFLCIQVDNAANIKSYLHETFRYSRVKGRFYKLTHHDIDTIKDLLCNYNIQGRMWSEIQYYLLNRSWEGLTFIASKLRLILDLGLPLIGFQLQDIYDLKEKTFIHPHCSAAILNTLEKYNVPLNIHEKILVQELKRNDYHDPEYVQELAQLLDKKLFDCEDTSKVKMELNKIFAVDGFGNQFSYTHYIDNLKYKMKEEPSSWFDPAPKGDLHFTHSIAIRQMYEKGATPLRVYEAIVQVFQQEERDQLTELGKLYQDCLGTLKNKVLVQVVQPKWNEELSHHEKPEKNPDLELGKEAE